jgi:multiple sugar transport system permease protein
VTTARRTTDERPRTTGLSDRTLALLFVLPSAILLVAFSVYPVLQAGRDSFYRIPVVTRVESFVGFANYAQLLQEESIRAAALRSLYWTVVNVVVQATLGLLIALALDWRVRGRDLARGLVLFPYMVPAIVIATIFRFTFNDITGIVNYLWQQLPGNPPPILFLADPRLALVTVTLVNCWKYTPFMVIVLLARLQTAPRDLYEAARIDGANAWQLFRDVTFPWLRPVLLIALLLRTIWTVNDFDVIYLLAFGGPLGATTTLPIEIRRLAFSQDDVGLASALAVVMALFVAAASFVFLRLYHRSEAQLQ